MNKGELEMERRAGLQRQVKLLTGTLRSSYQPVHKHEQAKNSIVHKRKKKTHTVHDSRPNTSGIYITSMDKNL